MTAKDNIAELDPVRALLLRLVEEKGTTLLPLSRKLGMNDAYLQQFVKMGKPKVLPIAVREGLAKFFGVHPNRFLPPDPNGRAVDAEPDPDLIARAVKAGERILGTDPRDQEMRAIITASAYVLLNRQNMGLPITDDDGTLYVFESLCKRLRSLAAARPPLGLGPSDAGGDNRKADD